MCEANMTFDVRLMSDARLRTDPVLLAWRIRLWEWMLIRVHRMRYECMAQP